MKYTARRRHQRGSTIVGPRRASAYASLFLSVNCVKIPTSAQSIGNPPQGEIVRSSHMRNIVTSRLITVSVEPACLVPPGKDSKHL